MMKFSEGPWVAESVATNAIAIINQAGEEVASVYTDGADVGEQDWADAKLIAAAPRMFEALEKARKALDIIEPDDEVLVARDLIDEVLGEVNHE